MARRLRQGIPPADHAKSLSCVPSPSSHAMFVCGFDNTQKIRLCGGNPLPHPAHAVARARVMPRRLRQGIPPADDAESLSSVLSPSSHEMFVSGFDYTQKIRVCGENPLPHPAYAVAHGHTSKPDARAETRAAV